MGAAGDEVHADADPNVEEGAGAGDEVPDDDVAGDADACPNVEAAGVADNDDVPNLEFELYLYLNL